ncbi:MAG: hypothetical protein GX755_09610 [Syntrophomonadaceae bacterium]|nr:hypothetical protein [Syntrophomonadaceae bacterium]
MIIKGSKGKQLGLGAGLLFFFLLTMLAGCQLPGFQPKTSESPPVLTKVEVHFTGNSEPLVGYIKDLDVAKDGTVYQGGSSIARLYDQNGNLIAVFNYARVEYIKIII